MAQYGVIVYDSRTPLPVPPLASLSQHNAAYHGYIDCDMRHSLTPRVEADDSFESSVQDETSVYCAPEFGEDCEPLFLMKALKKKLQCRCQYEGRWR